MTAAPTAQAESFTLTLERVLRRDVFLKEWHPLFEEIFPDVGDRESVAGLEKRLADPSRHVFHMIRHEGRPIGIELIYFNPKQIPGAMYVPYVGMIEPYRRKGIYPRIARASDERMKCAGIRYALYDLEDPWRPAELALAYPGEDHALVQKRAVDRIDFWRRQDAFRCHVINDADVPYLRPLSADLGAIQSYATLAFRFLGEADNVALEVFNGALTAIGSDAYRNFYLEIMRLEYGMRDEQELAGEFPAIRQFLAALDGARKEWIALHDAPRRSRERPQPAVIVHDGDAADYSGSDDAR